MDEMDEMDEVDGVDEMDGVLRECRLQNLVGGNGADADYSITNFQLSDADYSIVF